jgi:hypothetical protein
VARAEEAAEAVALAAPRPARLVSAWTASRRLHDVALGAWLGVLALLAAIELTQRLPTAASFAPHLLPLEPQVELAAWVGLALVAAAAAGTLGFRRALGALRTRTLRFGTALRAGLATVAATAHVALAFVD